jgi:hypothetical protein
MENVLNRILSFKIFYNFLIKNRINKNYLFNYRSF